MKRILILIADYGYRHHSAAIAIAEALQENHEQGCIVEIVNPLDDKHVPAILSVVSASRICMNPYMP
jgi:hypothetical protein